MKKKRGEELKENKKLDGENKKEKIKRKRQEMGEEEISVVKSKVRNLSTSLGMQSFGFIPHGIYKRARERKFLRVGMQIKSGE